VLFVFGAPGQLLSLAAQEHGRTIPLADIADVFISSHRRQHRHAAGAIAREDAAGGLGETAPTRLDGFTLAVPSSAWSGQMTGRIIVMRRITQAVLVFAIVGAAAVENARIANAQYYYPPPPPNCYAGGCCPPGMTIQGGACQPYRGPVGPRGYGYGYRPCPRGYTVQDGVCKPYRGY
jgi:hypothetical protein